MQPTNIGKTFLVGSLILGTGDIVTDGVTATSMYFWSAFSGTWTLYTATNANTELTNLTNPS